MTTSQANPPFSLNAGEPDPAVIRVAEDRRIEAASRLVTTARRVDEAAARRFLEYASSNQIGLDHFYAAIDNDGQIEASALAVPSPGRTAMVFATRFGGARPTTRMTERIAASIDHASRSVHQTGTRIAQALLEPRERAERDSFQRAGFEVLATLSYLQRNTNARRHDDTCVQWPADVTVEQYQPANENDLLDALELSYEETLDCPGLCGLRATADIFAGHKATGVFDPSLWSLMRVDGLPRGVLLLNPSSDGQSIELVYLGLAKSARGRGLGALLLRHGLSRLTGRNERTISLAVDECNAPAMRLYTRHGFRRLLRRVAMIRTLDAPSRK